MSDSAPAVQLVYQDPWLLGVYKPSGLLIHRNARFPDAEAAVQQARDLAGQRVYPVHRLDRAAAGLLLFALDAETARGLEQQFRAQTVDKRYLAVVRGWSDGQGEIDRPLRDEDRRGPARAARTEYQRLATVELPTPVGRYATARYSLLEVRPKTGRWHQIRRHLNGIDHPIIGDTAHGDRAHNRVFDRQLGRRRLLLVARALGCIHPATRRPLHLAVDPDAEFAGVLAWLGWDPAVTRVQPAVGSPPVQTREGDAHGTPP